MANIKTLLSQPRSMITVSFALGLAIGASSTYFATRKIISAKYADIAETEIVEAKEFYQRINKVGAYADPESAVKALVENERIVTTNGYDGLTPEILEPGQPLVRAQELGEPLVPYHKMANRDRLSVDGAIEERITATHAFKDARSANSYFDYDAEVPLRTPERPYIITEEEYQANEMNLSQSVLTYFEEDDVLMEEMDDNVIEDQHSVVGTENLTNFGKGSESRDVVFIRNERLAAEYEVQKNTGSYVQEVLGFVQSNEQRTSRRFRLEDG